MMDKLIHTNRLKRLKNRRKGWLKIHLYLGLFAGLVLAVVGFTGSILVFYIELQELLNAEQIMIPVSLNGQNNYLPLDDIATVAEKAKPAGTHLYKIYYPRNKEVAYKFLYFSEGNVEGYYIFVNPYTAQVTGTQLWHIKNQYLNRPLISFIMQLHWCLLLGGDLGGVIVGIVGMLSLISVLTGLILWWPLTGKFKQALTFKRNASSVRFNFDLHKMVGFYLLIVLIPVLFSGVYFNLPDQVNFIVKQFSPVKRINAFTKLSQNDFKSNPQLGQKPIGLAHAETVVEKRYPSGLLWMLSPPKDKTGVYKIMKRDVMELSQFVGYRDFIVDQYNGKILEIYESGTGSAGDVFLDWQWPLHSGFAFGWPGRILVFLAGLVCPVLYVTGVIRWLQKRKARAR